MFEKRLVGTTFVSVSQKTFKTLVGFLGSSAPRCSVRVFYFNGSLLLPALREVDQLATFHCLDRANAAIGQDKFCFSRELFLFFSFLSSSYLLLSFSLLLLIFY